MSIEFTQYLRPKGTPTKVKIDRPPEIETKAIELKSYGCLFEIEELMNGTVSMTVE